MIVNKQSFLVLIALACLWVTSSADPLLTLLEVTDLCKNMEQPRHGLFTPFMYVFRFITPRSA